MFFCIARSIVTTADKFYRYRRFIACKYCTFKLIKMEDRSTPQEKYLHNFTYAGKELSISEAKEIISKLVEDKGSVDLEKDVNGIAKICLNNSRSRNAVNAKMMIELDEVVSKLEQWTDYKGVILYGADGNFCSGGDLNMVRLMNNPETAYAMSTYMNYVLEKLRNLSMITVAYIEGAGAMGGGAELTTACDYRLMSSASDATGIGFVHAKMGIVPAWGSTGRLMSLVGQQKALDLLLDSRLLGAAEAMDAGLVDGTVATLADAAEWLSNRVRHDVNVIKAIKRTRLCYVGTGIDCSAAAIMERKIVVPLWGGPANRAALAQGIKHKKQNTDPPR